MFTPSPSTFLTPAPPGTSRSRGAHPLRPAPYLRRGPPSPQWSRRCLPGAPGAPGADTRGVLPLSASPASTAAPGPGRCGRSGGQTGKRVARSVRLRVGMLLPTLRAWGLSSYFGMRQDAVHWHLLRLLPLGPLGQCHRPQKLVLGAAGRAANDRQGKDAARSFGNSALRLRAPPSETARRAVSSWGPGGRAVEKPLLRVGRMQTG